MVDSFWDFVCAASRTDARVADHTVPLGGKSFPWEKVVTHKPTNAVRSPLFHVQLHTMCRLSQSWSWHSSRVWVVQPQYECGHPAVLQRGQAAMRAFVWSLASSSQLPPSWGHIQPVNLAPLLRPRSLRQNVRNPPAQDKATRGRADKEKTQTSRWLLRRTAPTQAARLSAQPTNAPAQPENAGSAGPAAKRTGRIESSPEQLQRRAKLRMNTGDVCAGTLQGRMRAACRAANSRSLRVPSVWPDHWFWAVVAESNWCSQLFSRRP